MRNFIFLCLSLFFLLSLNAQESAIKGWVRDNVTEQGLIGATVTVKLQAEVITGTVTDADGHFYIKGLAAGRYQLEFSYTGYKAVTLPNVLITSGKETEMEVVMEEGIVLEEAVIVATADKDKFIANHNLLPWFHFQKEATKNISLMFATKEWAFAA